MMHIARATIPLILLFVLSLLSSCGTEDTKINEQEINFDFTYTAQLNDYLYGFSDEEIKDEDIDKLIGDFTGPIASPLPNKDGQVACKYSECPAPDSYIFFTIKNVPTGAAIARKVDIGNDQFKYFKCTVIIALNKEN